MQNERALQVPLVVPYKALSTFYDIRYATKL